MVWLFSCFSVFNENFRGDTKTAYDLLAAGDTYRFDVDLEVGDDGSMMTKTVTITLSAAAAYMVLVVGLMLYCRYRRRRRKQQYLQEQAEGIYLLRSLNESVSDFAPL